MPPKSKGLTYATRLRTTESERATVAAIQAAAAEAGIAASLNDVIRHLVRRACLPPARTEADARAAIVAHWDNCPDCDPSTVPRCLDGLHLQRCYTQVVSTPVTGRVGSKAGMSGSGRGGAHVERMPTGRDHSATQRDHVT